MFPYLDVAILSRSYGTPTTILRRAANARREEPLQSTGGFGQTWLPQTNLWKQPVTLPVSQDGSDTMERLPLRDRQSPGTAAIGWSGGALPATVGGFSKVSQTTGPLPGDALVTRAFDIMLALLLLLAALPVLAVALSAVRLTSKGPIIFRQYRVGRFGRPFVCYKIRTMVEDASALLERDHPLRGSYAERWKLADDPRVLPVGRWLRRASIDELPQLVNVLRGEMSVVGPRPVQLKELHERYGELAEVVFSVNPGLTGLWQVSGRSSLDYAQRIALDLEYVRRRSIWLDVLLVFKTIPAVCFGRGAC